MNEKKKFSYQKYNYDGIVERKYNLDKWCEWEWSWEVFVHLDAPTGQIYYMDFKN